MAIQARQVALNATTAVPVLVPSVSGRNSAFIRNTDASILVYIGGPGVTSTTGLVIPAATTLGPLDLEVGDDVYAIAASATPTVSTLTRT